jgi:hypothetical protein
MADPAGSWDPKTTQPYEPYELNEPNEPYKLNELNELNKRNERNELNKRSAGAMRACCRFLL